MTTADEAGPRPGRARPGSATVPAAIAALRVELLALMAKLRGQGVARARAALATAEGPARTRAPAAGNSVVAAHLHAALAAVAGAEPELAKCLDDAAPQLRWRTYDEYPEAEIGPAFGRSHAYALLIGGPDAAWPSTTVDVGLFLMAPGLFYRDHAHPATELYLPFTGPHSWRRRPDAPLVPRPAFAPVWNRSGAPHATKVGRVPFLCLYAWFDNLQAPARVIPALDWARHES